jgi:hypothetical protein
VEVGAAQADERRENKQRLIHGGVVVMKAIPLLMLLVLPAVPALADDPNEDTSEKRAKSALLAALENLGDPTVCRGEALTDFQNIARDFPNAPGSVRVRDAIAILKRMVEEENERLRQRPIPAKQMTRQRQVAELIYRLREQKGYSPDWFGCDIFNDLGPPVNGESGKSPAHRLVEMGYDAIPQLIDALEDDRFSRSIEPTTLREHMLVLQVGDCALAIIERIAGRTFKDTTGRLGNGCGPMNKKVVVAWWREFREKGERMMLIEGTTAGDDNSVRQAKRLLERHPDAALFALNRGIRNCKAREIRCQLLGVANELRGDVVVPLFRSELKGPMLESRIVGARFLLQRDYTDGIAPMIAEWHTLAARPQQERPKLSGFGAEFSEEGRLIEFLARCGRKETVEALAVNLKSQPVRRRWNVVWALSDPYRRYEDKVLAPEVQAAMDTVLVECLSDAERVPDQNFPSSFRICDVAADKLAELWKQPKLFDRTATTEARDQQILAVRNVWLKKQGKPALPLSAATKGEARK